MLKATLALVIWMDMNPFLDRISCIAAYTGTHFTTLGSFGLKKQFFFFQIWLNLF
jgi:hypothetical protein